MRLKERVYAQHLVILMDDALQVTKIALKSVVLNGSGGFPMRPPDSRLAQFGPFLRYDTKNKTAR